VIRCIIWAMSLLGVADPLGALGACWPAIACPCMLPPGMPLPCIPPLCVPLPCVPLPCMPPISFCIMPISCPIMPPPCMPPLCPEGMPLIGACAFRSFWRSSISARTSSVIWKWRRISVESMSGSLMASICLRWISAAVRFSLRRFSTSWSGSWAWLHALVSARRPVTSSPVIRRRVVPIVIRVMVCPP
jgi:hypothetical protein